jgi:hypothetical protein
MKGAVSIVNSLFRHLALAIVATLVPALRAELVLPAIFGDHMVLQQLQANRIWGWDAPGTKIIVRYSDRSVTTTAGPDGTWVANLPGTLASGTPRTLIVQGSSTRRIDDVLVSEVWICSGQSNMAFPLANAANGDLAAAAGSIPALRLIQVPPDRHPGNSARFPWQLDPGHAGDRSHFQRGRLSLWSLPPPDPRGTGRPDRSRMGRIGH